MSIVELDVRVQVFLPVFKIGWLKENEVVEVWKYRVKMWVGVGSGGKTHFLH